VEWEVKLDADLDVERVGWGDIDDETLALYAAGTCPPEDHALVEAAMLRHPVVRELVEDIRQRGFFVPQGPRARLGRRFWLLAATAVLIGLAIVMLLAELPRR
jgi:hypothetical protein